VRIIGGTWKRTPLQVATVPGLRPTPDRVRETLFNWLTHLVGDYRNLRGLDLFAGTGALGFELASRGARAVTLVESDPAALEQLRAARTRLAAAQVEIEAGDGLAFAGRQAPGSFDIVLLDPPFESALAMPALAAARRLLAENGLVYLEQAAPLPAEDAASCGFALIRAGRAGRVAFHLLRPQSA
jgi:16S rRNA (guanine(966)-N(2))-methyltransferase RsmD